MRKWFLLMLPLCGLLFAAPLHAATVKATTSGVVTPETADGLTITFTGKTIELTAANSLVDFGYFTVSGTLPSSDPALVVTRDFVLTVTQSLPVGGSADILGDITGTIRVGSNRVNLTLASASVTLPGGGLPFDGGVTYTLLETNIGVAGDTRSLPFDVDAFGTVDFVAVPLPAGVWGGLGLLGSLAAARFVRRRA